MKIFIFVFLLLFSLLSRTAQSQALRAVDFFEVIHPDNKRDSSWPDKLVIERITQLTQKEFDKEIQGRWRNTYHCAGKPIKPSERHFDGIARGYLDFIFKNGTFAREEIDKLTKIKKEDSPYNVISKYRFTESRNGRFLCKLQGFSDSEFWLIYLPETGEFGFHSEGATHERCPDGSEVQVILVPIQKEIS